MGDAISVLQAWFWFGSRTLALCLVLLLSGCQTLFDDTLYGPHTPDDAWERLVVQADVEPVSDQDVLALTPEMRALVRSIQAQEPDKMSQVKALAAEFVPGQGLGLRYAPLATHTAAQTLQGGEGNCLAFTHLFIAMARDLGVDVRYREVRVPHRWDEVGDYVLLNLHVAAYGRVPGQGTFEADFGYLDWRENQFGRFISDDRARAQHFNNLGAESLTRDDYRAAQAHFLRALHIDRELSYVWANLGTALMRLQRPEDAEAAFQEALRLDHNDGTALSQLIRLYESEGADDLAHQYRERINRRMAQNPYQQFNEGVEALEAGDLRTATNLLRRAVRGRDDELHFHLQLGRAYALQGQQRRARSSLLRAAELSQRQEDERAITAVLDELGEAARQLDEQQHSMAGELPPASPAVMQ